MKFSRSSFVRFFSFILIIALLSGSAFAKKKKGKGKGKGGGHNAATSFKTITGKVALKEQLNDNFTRIYQIGQTSVSKSCEDEVRNFMGKNVKIVCRIFDKRILQIVSIIEVAAKPKANNSKNKASDKKKEAAKKKKKPAEKK